MSVAVDVRVDVAVLDAVDVFVLVAVVRLHCANKNGHVVPLNPEQIPGNNTFSQGPLVPCLHSSHKYGCADVTVLVLVVERVLVVSTGMPFKQDEKPSPHLVKLWVPLLKVT